MFSLFTVPAVPQLETERLVLRELKKSDADDMFCYCGSEYAAKYGLWYPHSDISETRAYIAWQRKMISRGKLMLWAVVHRQSGRVIGTCSLTPENGQGAILELGYGFLREFWGAGYCTEAVGKLLEYAFSVGAVRVFAKMLSENEQSVRLAERVGMRREGLLKNGIICKEHPRDVLLYAVIECEYSSRENDLGELLCKK